MISRMRPRRKTHSPCPAVRVVAAVLLLAAPGTRAADADDGWPQFGRTAQHTGVSPVRAEPLESIRAEIVYDPFVDAMKAESDGDLLAHYSPPLVDDTGVYMVFKSGVWTGFGNWSSITWSVRKLA